jgi:hypothetical protein
MIVILQLLGDHYVNGDCYTIMSSITCTLPVMFVMNTLHVPTDSQKYEERKEAALATERKRVFRDRRLKTFDLLVKEDEIDLGELPDTECRKVCA